MKKYLFLLCLLLSAAFTTALAANYVCPNSYQTVLTGDSMQKVTAACGKPTSTTTQTTYETKPLVLTQWVYTIGNVQAKELTEATPQLLITFKKDKVFEISTSNQSAAAVFNCYRMKQITIGSTSQQVRTACGAPAYVNSIQRGTKEAVKIDQWTYNFGAYRPTIIFTFNNGVLADIKMGQMGK